MRLITIFTVFSLIVTVFCKNNVRTLTESMGQEIIEIDAPIKELPLGLEEEPAAENDDTEKPRMTTHPIPVATKKEMKKIASTTDARKRVKDVEKIDGMAQDDDEARIEKELAEIYKDTADYKSDSAEEKEVAKEITTTTTTTTTTKPTNPTETNKPTEPSKRTEPSEPTEIYESNDDSMSSEEELSEKSAGREKTNFKFQPDSTSKEDVDRFRTSIDNINCNLRQKLTLTTSTVPKESKSSRSIRNGASFLTVVLCCIFICS